MIKMLLLFDDKQIFKLSLLIAKMQRVWNSYLTQRQRVICELTLDFLPDWEEQNKVARGEAQKLVKKTREGRLLESKGGKIENKQALPWFLACSSFNFPLHWLVKDGFYIQVAWYKTGIFWICIFKQNDSFSFVHFWWSEWRLTKLQNYVIKLALIFNLLSWIHDF